jgi:uncharacterized protein YdaU (DUF1376 family)
VHYYSFRINDHAAETGHLSLLEDAIYRRLIDLYFRTEKPLQDDASELARVIRARGHENEIASILKEFFFLKKAGWFHVACDEQLASFKAKSDKARHSAEQRWSKTDANAMRTHSERNATVMPTHSERNANAMLTNNQEPITNNHKPITKNQEEISGQAAADKPLNSPSPKAKKLTTTIERPDGCDEVVWSDWLRVRGKNPLTQTAWAGMTSEASKAGITPAEAVRICAERGWRGFRADWLANDKAKRRGGYEPEDLSKQDYRSHDGEKFVAGSAAEYFYGKDYVRRQEERRARVYDRSKEELA